MRAYLDLMQHILDHGADKTRPHRHRHALRLRPPDAVRPGGRLSAADHQEAARQVHHLRVAVVHQRRHQRALAAGTRGAHLGRVGGRGGRAGSGLRQAVALVADGGRPHGRPADGRDRPDQAQPGLAAADRQRLERRGDRADGAAAVPRALPVLRRRTAACRASFTSARSTSSWACRSTSRRTRC